MRDGYHRATAIDRGAPEKRGRTPADAGLRASTDCGLRAQPRTPLLPIAWRSIMSALPYIHPRPSHNAAQYEGHPELTGAAWGFASETATHALRIVYSGVFDRFPTAKLVLGHLGESLPFPAWRIQHGINFSPNGRGTKRRLADYLADNIWVTTSGNSAPRRFIAQC